MLTLMTSCYTTQWKSIYSHVFFFCVFLIDFSGKTNNGYCVFFLRSCFVYLNLNLNSLKSSVRKPTNICCFYSRASFVSRSKQHRGKNKIKAFLEKLENCFSRRVTHVEATLPWQQVTADICCDCCVVNRNRTQTTCENILIIRVWNMSVKIPVFW